MWHRVLTIPAAAVLLAGTFAGCAAFSEGSSEGHSSNASTADVGVVAAFYPLAFVAERVGGPTVAVTNLTQPGAEPHDLELTPKETALVEDADIVLIEDGLQPAVDDAAREIARGEVLDAAEVVDLLPGDDGDPDPHFWLDPRRMATLADAVAEALAKADPDQANDYRANAAALAEELDALATEYEAGLQGCERDTIVVSHDAFSYLEQYGLRVEGIAGLSPDAEPTPADLARLHDLITTEGITTVFSERLVSPELASTLADDLGITTAVLDPIEGLGPDTADEDYLSLMRANLAALRTANGCPAQ